MKNVKKFILLIVLLALPVFLLSASAKPVLAADNSAQEASIQQQIQSLIKQIIALIQQLVQLRINEAKNLVAQQIKTNNSTISANSTITGNN